MSQSIDMNSARAIAEQACIVRGLVGSTVHGIALEGTDDRDEMGICLEPPNYVIGLQRFEQWVHRTAWERTGTGISTAQQPKSRHGDVDLTIYSLRKWCRLALQGNPSILLLLFVPDEQCPILTADGRALRALAPLFASQRAGRRFLGYAVAQRERFLGPRGSADAQRPEFVQRHGYDTKYAMHMLRLGLQGVEYLTTGRLTLPMPAHQRDWLLRVRQGKAEVGQILESAYDNERRLQALLTTSPLPEHPNVDGVNEFLCATYLCHWGYSNL